MAREHIFSSQFAVIVLGMLLAIVKHIGTSVLATDGGDVMTVSASNTVNPRMFPGQIVSITWPSIAHARQSWYCSIDRAYLKSEFI